MRGFVRFDWNSVRETGLFESTAAVHITKQLQRASFQPTVASIPRLMEDPPTKLIPSSDWVDEEQAEGLLQRGCIVGGHARSRSSRIIARTKGGVVTFRKEPYEAYKHQTLRQKAAHRRGKGLAHVLASKRAMVRSLPCRPCSPRITPLRSTPFDQRQSSRTFILIIDPESSFAAVLRKYVGVFAQQLTRARHCHRHAR